MELIIKLRLKVHVRHTEFEIPIRSPIQCVLGNRGLVFRSKLSNGT